MGRDNFNGERGARYKLYRHSIGICAPAAERIEMPFGLWTRVGPRKKHY